MNVTMPPRIPLDLHRLTPGDLREASQSVFVRVVDADLKRNSRAEGKQVPEWITEALRGEHLDRWRVALQRMLTQVNGRLQVMATEWEANEVSLQGPARRNAHEEYMRQKVRSERFRQGVLDTLAEADALYETRLDELESAIRAHRDEVEADSTIDPSAADQRLWATLNDD